MEASEEQADLALQNVSGQATPEGTGEGLGRRRARSQLRLCSFPSLPPPVQERHLVLDTPAAAEKRQQQQQQQSKRLSRAFPSKGDAVETKEACSQQRGHSRRPVRGTLGGLNTSSLPKAYGSLQGSTEENSDEETCEQDAAAELLPRLGGDRSSPALGPHG
ncbi:hypothetical protein Emag_001067 [Eimeria magna]